jgi:diaminopimelate decarboxylase
MAKCESTTSRLDELMTRHAPSIGRVVERFRLPAHVLFLDEMARNARAFLDAAQDRYPNTIVAFAVKSNPCRGAIRAASALELGADVASEFELRAALEEGIAPGRITCNGNAKSDTYISDAIGAGALIAADNADELDRIETIAQEQDRTPTVLVRFRGMPLSGLTSDDQTTASDWTKFGFHVDEAESVFSRIRASDAITFGGISAHIGTQIADPAGYERLLEHLFALAEAARRIGLEVSHIDIGGGFPVRFLSEVEWRTFTQRLLARVRGEGALPDAVTWNDRPMGYAHVRGSDVTEPDWIGKSYWTSRPGSLMLQHLLQHRFADGRTTVARLTELGSPTLIAEPGRALMATAGVTLTQVMGVKDVLGHRVVSLDLGINNHGTNLISPDVFPAAVLPVREGDRATEAFLAGRLCFSGDMISKAKVPLNRAPNRGERFVLYHTGAYGADHFASHSCGFPRPAKVAIRSDGEIEVWRLPDRFEDVFGFPDDVLSLG